MEGSERAQNRIHLCCPLEPAGLRVISFMAFPGVSKRKTQHPYSSPFIPTPLEIRRHVSAWLCSVLIRMAVWPAKCGSCPRNSNGLHLRDGETWDIKQVGIRDAVPCRPPLKTPGDTEVFICFLCSLCRGLALSGRWITGHTFHLPRLPPPSLYSRLS